MDIIDLPVADDSTSLEDALRTMRKKRRSAIVYQSAKTLRVIDVDLVIYALRHRRLRRVADLKPRHRSIRAADVLPTTERTTAKRIVSNLDARQRIADGMDKRGATFALVRTRGDRAEILARHDPYRPMLHRVESVWVCSGRVQHYWQTSQLASGNSCPSDGSACTRL